MKPRIIYANQGGLVTIRDGIPRTKEACDACEYVPKKSGPDVLARRDFVRRLGGLLVPITIGGGLFLPRDARAGNTIITRTISSATETAVAMSNATFARSVSLPSGWNKIRIGIRAHINGTGATLSGLTTLAMGWCSGTNNQYGDATTDHFVGCALENSNLGWSACGGMQNYYVPTTGILGRKRIGTTNTDTAALNGNGCGYTLIGGLAGSNVADQTAIFIDLFKGSPNYTFHFPFVSTTCCSVPPINGQMTAARFLLYMAQLNPSPIEQSYDASSAVDRTMAVSESTNGTLNAINVAWNRSDAILEVCDLAASVLA